MICKHLIQLKGAVDAEFFHKIQRNYSYPFIWKSIHEIPYEISFIKIIGIPENSTDLTEKI